MRRISTTFATILATGGLSLALAAEPAAAQTILRFSNWVPPRHPISTGIFAVWARNVEQATSGRVKVEILSALGKPPAHYDLVKSGVADVAMAVHSYTADRFPLTYGAELPFYANTSRAASIAYWRMHERFLAPAGEHGEVKLVGVWVHGPAMIFTVSKPVHALADLRGLKIRVAGGITQDIAEALGTTPFFAPATQAYEVLSKGVADGIFFPAESVASFKIDRILKHALVVPGGLYRSSQYMVMNRGKWDALSAADRTAIDRVSGEALAALAGDVWDEADRVGMEAIRAAGAEVQEVRGAFLDELKSRLTPLEKAWLDRVRATGVDGAAALGFYRTEIGKLE